MRWIVVALIALNAATCGQKGPLRLPEPQAATQQTFASLHLLPMHEYRAETAQNTWACGARTLSGLS